MAGEPTEWVRWLLRDTTAEVEEWLSGEFQFILRHSDAILRVRGREGSFILVVEVQLRADRRMPRRMRAYAALAEERYNLPVYPVVFYLLAPSKEVEPPGYYHSEFMGLVAHQDFRVVKVWEIEARRVLEEGVTALLPFMPLMKGVDEEIIRAGARLLREREVGEETEVALALFASFVMEPEQLQRIVRWDMAVLRESPWYKQILEEGLQQGLQQG
ncbi:MAG TPA: Rpn family recombination-promoting nuclease/putative transposase, partial [Thermoflexia bacterium]|nr:Rpn family recombination-promoting nuclease/putative transposase [Thermoflexia bacterium]